MDLLTFVPNINTFRQALRDSGSEFVNVDDDNNVQLLIDSIPVRTKGDKTLTLLRCNDAQKVFIESIPSVTILCEYSGTADYTLTAAARTKFKSVYSTVAVEIDDGEGGTYTHTPAKLIGVFAD